MSRDLSIFRNTHDGKHCAFKTSIRLNSLKRLLNKQEVKDRQGFLRNYGLKYLAKRYGSRKIFESL